MGLSGGGGGLHSHWNLTKMAAAAVNSGEGSGQPGGAMVAGELGERKGERRARYRGARVGV